MSKFKATRNTSAGSRARRALLCVTALVAFNLAALVTQNANAGLIGIQDLIGTGDPVPGSTETFLGFFRDFNFQPDGSVILYTTTTTVSGDFQGFYQASSDGITSIVRVGDNAPNPGIDAPDLGTIAGFGSSSGVFYSINDNGSIVFMASTSDGPFSRSYVFFVGPTTPLEIITPPTYQVEVGPTFETRGGFTGVSGATGEAIGPIDIRPDVVALDNTDHFYILETTGFSSSSGSLFHGTSSADLVNAHYRGDVSPDPNFDLPGHFTFFAGLSDGGVAYVSGEASSPTRDTFWRLNADGSNEHIFTAEEAAPGLPGLTFSIPILLSGPGSTYALYGSIFGGTSAQTGLYVGTSRADLSLLAITGTSVTTSVGNVTFSSLVPIQFVADGKLYFRGIGTIEGGTGISDFFVYDPGTGSITPLNLIGTSQIQIIDIRDNGDIAYGSWTSAGNAAIFVRSADDTITSVIAVGDEIDGKVVTQLLFGRVGIYADFISDTELGFRAGFGPSIGGNFNEDTRLFVATFDNSAPPAVTAFTWDGECGSTNWHDGCSTTNWNDPDGIDAEHVPGDPAGDGSDETIRIVDATVVIKDAAVHVASVNATGELEVLQPLTIDGTSSIEDVYIAADLMIGGIVNLKGSGSFWADGDIGGNGTLWILSAGGLAGQESASELNIVFDNQSISQSITAELKVGGKLIMSEGHAKTNVVNILPGGELEMQGGRLGFTSSATSLLTNDGLIRKVGPGEAIITTNLVNNPNSFMIIEEGTLLLDFINQLNGDISIRNGAQLDLGRDAAGLAYLCNACGTLDISGAGVLKIASTVAWNGTASASDIVFELRGETGKLLISDGAKLEVQADSTSPADPVGGFTNKGNVEFFGGTINGLHIINEGEIHAKNSTIIWSGTLDNKDGATTTFESSGPTTLDINNWGTLEITGSDYGPLVPYIGKLTMKKGNLTVDTESIFGIFTESGDVADSADSGLIIEGDSTLSGSGTLAIGFGGKIVVNKDVSLTNNMGSVDGLFGAILVGGETKDYGLISRGHLTGEGTILNVGEIIFAHGSIDGGLDVVNSGFFEIISSGTATRLLDARLRNSGPTAEVLQTATLMLGTDGIINNAAIYELNREPGDPEVNIELDPAVTSPIEATFFNLAGGTLLKTGEGSSTIEVSFFNQGKIEILQSELLIRSMEPGGNIAGAGHLIFFDGGTVSISEGAGLYLMPAESQEFIVSGRTVITNKGQLDLDFLNVFGVDTTALSYASAGSNLVVNGGLFNWWKGDIDFKQYGTAAGQLGGLFIMGDARMIIKAPPDDTKSLVGQGNLFVDTEATVEQLGDLILGSDTSMLVHGAYMLNGKIDNQVSGSSGMGLFILASDGTLQIGSDTSPSAAEINVRSKLSGTIDLKPNSVLIAGPAIDVIVGDTLIAGTWILEEGSRVDLSTSIARTPSIRGLGHGVTLTLARGATFNNLPVVDSDFLISVGAELSIVNENFQVQGQLQNNGTLALTSGTITTSGGYFHNFLTGILKGSGTIDGMVVNDGSFDLGSSPGVLTINGDYTQTATGMLDIEIGGPMAGIEYDQLIVNGTATFEAGTMINISFLDLDGDGEVYIPTTGTTIDFLLADDIVFPAGMSFEEFVFFSNLPAGLRFDFNLVDGIDGLMLQLYAIYGTHFAEILGLSGRVSSIGAALDAATISDEGDGILDFALAIEALTSTAAQEAALVEAGLSFGSGLLDSVRLAARSVNGEVTRHLDQVIWGDLPAVRSLDPRLGALGYTSGNSSFSPFHDSQAGMTLRGMEDVFVLSQLSAGAEPGEQVVLKQGGGARLFMSGSAQFANYDRSANQSAFEITGGTATLGFDMAADDLSWLVGASGHYSALDGEAEGTLGESEVTSFGLSVFAMHQLGELLVADVSASWIRSDIETTRHGTLPGFGFTAMGDTEATTLTGRLRLSAPYKVGKGGKLGPFVELAAGEIDIDGYRESGAGAQGLNVDGLKEEFVTGRIGVKGQVPLSFSWGTLTTSIEAGFEHEFDGTAPAFDASFIGAPGTSFANPTDAPSADALMLGLGVHAKTKGAWTFSASYALRKADNFDTHNLTARAVMRF